MAATAGKDGRVTVGGNNVAGLKSWELDIEADMLDTTNFESTDDWREFISGLKGASGSASGHWDMTDTAQAAMQSAILGGTSVAMVLNTDTGAGSDNTYTITAFITNLKPGAEVEGLVEVSFDFQVTGAPVFA